MRGCFGASGSADEFVALSAGFFAQALRFFGKAGFKGLGLFEMAAMLHDTTSCLRVLTAGFSISDPNMPQAGSQFQSEHFKLGAGGELLPALAG
jgi:hypothetical protein